MMDRSLLKYGVGLLGILAVIGGVVVLRPVSKPLPSPSLAAPTSTPPVLDEYPVHRILGRSVEGRPIDAYAYGTGTTTLLFVGGVHGGYEWNSVLLSYAFMDHLALHREFVPTNMTLIVVPSANPDGVYKVTHKEGRFALGDVDDTGDEGAARFNAHSVDLNRNFDCKWKPTSKWKSRTVSAGTAPFSEPESVAIRDAVRGYDPVAVVFFHSKANAVYASECEKGILPDTLVVMDTYAKAAGYPSVRSFDSYAVTGDAEGWLASIGIPAITVELSSHDTIEWDRNLRGITALVAHYAVQGK